MSESTEELAAKLEGFRVRFGELKAEVQRAVVGYDDLLTETLIAVFSGGHVLLEGVPGLGKTFLVKTLSDVLGLESGRVQCTPDLMPADILGTQIVNEDGAGKRSLHFEKGPVFRNLLLVDEINRATPKTQAALLEVMQERSVTVAGETHQLPRPFFVLATQNPMEMEGTYPLPEAQLDRFLFKIRVPFPDLESLVEISKRTTGSKGAVLSKMMSGEDVIGFQQALGEVAIADELTTYAARLVLASHPGGEGAPERVNRYVSYGSSPRGLQALIWGAKARAALDNRCVVGAADLQQTALVAMRHRIILNFEGEAESIDSDALVAEILEAVKTPAQEVG